MVDPFVDTVEDIPQIQIEVDLAAAREYGLKPGDVRRSTSTLIMGEEVGDLFRNGQTFDVNVWHTGDAQNLTDIENLLIDTPSGEYVHLADVADLRIVPTPNDIHHEELSRSIDVSANVDGRDLGSRVVGELQDRMEEVQWPLEFRTELLGEFTERQAPRSVCSCSRSPRRPACSSCSRRRSRAGGSRCCRSTLPIALVGGVLAAYLGGGVLTLGSLVGFFTVLGIVARSGIMLISHYQHLEQFEGEPFGLGLVIEALVSRSCRS